MTALVAGVLGTLAMDLLNRLLSRTGMLVRIDVRAIGRMAAGWTRGRFRYDHPSEMPHVEHELLCGSVTHYGIGVVLALPYLLGWSLLLGGPASAAWAIVYGLATTVASYCLVYPSMGLGMLGRHAPEGIRAPLSSLANHLFYGAGLALGVALR
ncbi:MAG: DUF2938 family protein [Candidatus Eiseniibacteriota bacterium]|jgi:hypothetical protein